MDANWWAAIAAAISAAISAAALILGIFTWLAQTSEHRMDAILSQAVKSLESAYNTLTDAGTVIPPPLDRLGWLTTARHLLRYQQLRAELSSIQKTICDEQEEHWRHKFYRAVEPLSEYNGYFSQARDPQRQLPPPVQLESAVVVLAFAEWPEGREDPLDKVKIEDFLKQTPIVTMRYPHLEHELRKAACVPTTPS